MAARVNGRLGKIRTLSRFGHVACIALMILVCLIACLLVVGSFAFPDATCDFGAGPQKCGELSAGARGLALALLVAGAALGLKGLYHLSQLFTNYARGDIFTRESVRQIKRIGSTALIFGAFEIAVLIATWVLAGFQQITWPEHRPIPLPFGAFVSGALIMLVAWVMELGTELREETELTI